MTKGRVAAALATVALALGACGDSADDPGSTTSTEPATPAERVKELDRKKKSNNPVLRAEAYAVELFPEATATDDFLAAAVSGCYWGITTEYLGGPANLPPEKAAKLEYPEPDLQAILNRAREDCRE